MYDLNLLLTSQLPPLSDSFLENLKNNISIKIHRNLYDEFKDKATAYFTGSTLNNLSGFDSFSKVDIIMGCNHFIDSLLIEYGLQNIQIFEHDYRYYSRLNKNIQYATLGNLNPAKPLLIALPFPGHLDIHKNMKDILNECLSKGIAVHIDGSWMSSASGIDFDFSHPAISSFGMSLSKGMALGWNRIGLRWSRVEKNDNVTIFNNFGMIQEVVVATGIYYLDNVPIDYLWNTYGDKYKDICRTLKLRPTKIIHAAMSIDRSILYGLKPLLTESQI